MAALPDPPLMSIEEYLATSFPDGDREFLDGVVVERNVGTIGHSRLQKLILKHLLLHEVNLQFEVLPECRTRIGETRYRVPDVVIMLRPYRDSGRVLLDAPFLVVEVVSPDDRVTDSLKRFRDYEALGVNHIVQMDPEDRRTYVFTNGSLISREVEGFEIPGRGFLPFNTREILARLDD